jgi:phospholipase C
MLLLVSRPAQSVTQRTPIEHVVIIHQENQSFDHYFATYPTATNPPGEPPFFAVPGTPKVNGLSRPLLVNNPNLNAPFRFDRSQAKTLIGICDNNHDYTSEQQAYDGGLLDQFVQLLGPNGSGCTPDFVMGFVDGNTVTALWNYAQHFAISDNHFGSTFGPSMPGAINLAAGQTAGAFPANVSSPSGAPWVANGTMIGNPPAAFDDCAEETGMRVQFAGKNIGDLLNDAGLTWGWFSAGFQPTVTLPNGTVRCGQFANGDTGPILVYDDPDPFDYYKSTANPHHLPPTSQAMIGKTDEANHQYAFDDFWTAAAAGNMPAVSFLRGSEVTDGHPGYSDPLAEQGYLVEVLNRLQQLPQWHSTVVFITWDDSDGWYDHVMPPIVNQSQDPAHDGLLAGGSCGTRAPLGRYPDRCGYGPRIPLVIISPFAKPNFVLQSVNDASSLIRFIEDNWNLGRIGSGSFDAIAGSLLDAFDFAHPHNTPLLLDPDTGEVTASR